jgi:hypothetical protein
MKSLFTSAVAAVLLSGSSLYTASPADAGWYRGGHQLVSCAQGYRYDEHHRRYSNCFRRGTAGFSFARGAATPFYVGMTDQYDLARDRRRYRHGHNKHTMKFSK